MPAINQTLALNFLGTRPETYGALGDGAHDDTAAIQAAIDAAGADGLVYFTPKKTYKTTAALAVTVNRQTWIAHNAKIVRYGNGIAVQIGIPNPTAALEKVWDFHAWGGRIFRSTLDYSVGNIGIQFLNTNNSSWFDFEIQNFNTGIELLGDGGTGNRFIGCQYSTLMPRWIVNCKQPIRIYAQNNAWCNASNWYGGGRVGYYSELIGDNADDASGAYALTIDRDGSNNEVVNQHIFHGLTLEDAFTAGHAKKPAGAVYANCQDCHFYGGRVEGFTTPKVNLLGADVSGCSFQDVQSLLLPSQDYSLPSGNNPRAVYIRENRALYLCGGSSTDAALTLREKNDATKPILQIQNTDGTKNIEARGAGGIRQAVNATFAAWEGALWMGTKQWQPTETGQAAGTIRAGKFAITTVTISGGVARKGDPALVGYRGDLGLGAAKDEQCLIWSAQVASDLGGGFNTVRVIAYNPGPADITGMPSDTLTVYAKQASLT